MAEVKKKKVTIDAVANAAGVSKTTVSRYLNGRTDLMSEATAQKIEQIIALCDYHPSEYARALKSNRTRMVGIIIAEIMNPWSAAIISECGRVLSENGYTPLFFNSNNDLDNEKHLVSLLTSKNVVGLIVNPVSYSDPYLVEYRLRGIPVVLCDRLIRDYPFDAVISEMHDPIHKLISHLKQQGYTRPVFFTQEWQNNYARFSRIEAYRAAMISEFGYCNEDDIYTIRVHNSNDAFTQLRDLMNSRKPDERIAAFCGNTMTLLRLLNSAQRLGYSIPDEIGLCGPDDWDWDESISLPVMLYPELTTIKINTRQIGAQCANMILRKIRAPESEHELIKVPCSLSLRASTRRSK